MQTVRGLGAAAKNSHRSVIAALKYLATVVVQDAVEDAQRLADNPVHRLLMAQPIFRSVTAAHHCVAILHNALQLPFACALKQHSQI